MSSTTNEFGHNRREPVPVLLTRGTARAAWWSLLSLALVAAGVFLIVDSGGHPGAWIALVAFAVPAGFFVLQLVWPGATAVRLDLDAFRSRTIFWRTEVPWEQVHLARVRRVAGDPVLALEVRQPSPTGDDWRNRVIAVLLPIGCDLEPLHAFLEARLGSGSRLPSPRTLRPLDL